MNLQQKEIPWPSPNTLAQWVQARPHRVWLDSALTSHPKAKFSILCGDPVEQWDWNPGSERWKEVQNWMKSHAPDKTPPLGFWGGVVGFLSYESWPEGLPWTPRCHDKIPAVHFMGIDTALILDHAKKRARVFSWGMDGNATDSCEQLAAEISQERPSPEGPPDTKVSMESLISKKKYLERVKQIKEAIAAGTFYQVNYAYPIEIKGWEDPAALYLAWRSASPAPQMVFWNLKSGQILSASPEILLEISGDRIRSYPIKGTRPRGKTKIQDDRLGHQLLQSEKDGAELLMIVDLVRNDLGKVCEVGSITVPQLKKLETFPQVHHLVAQVEGRLSFKSSPLKALQALFPGGSITGAPKRKAMEWIQELEGQPRGIYTGSIGYWSFNGESCFNIAIRSGFFSEGSMEYWVGSGIVSDSDPGAEYQETLDKSQGLMKGLGKNVRTHLL